MVELDANIVPGGRPEVFDGGNEWATSTPFYELPSWWRRFVFRVLTPRDFVVYCYVVSYCGKRKIAYPLIRHMKTDLNIANSSVIHESLRRLVAKGFLLKETRVVEKLRRNVYQRPSIEYTLMVLLENNLVNGYLVPPSVNKKEKAAERSDYRGRGRGSVEGGLQKLLAPEQYQSWESASDANKASELYNILAAVIAERRAAHQFKPAASEADGISLYDTNESGDASTGGVSGPVVQPGATGYGDFFDMFFNSIGKKRPQPPESKPAVEDDPALDE